MTSEEKKRMERGRCFDCRKKIPIVFLPRRAGIRMDCPYCGFWLEYKTGPGGYRSGGPVNKKYAYARSITWTEHKRYLKHMNRVSPAKMERRKT